MLRKFIVVVMLVGLFLTGCDSSEGIVQLTVYGPWESLLADPQRRWESQQDAADSIWPCDETARDSDDRGLFSPGKGEK